MDQGLQNNNEPLKPVNTPKNEQREEQADKTKEINLAEQTIHGRDMFKPNQESPTPTPDKGKSITPGIVTTVAPKNFEEFWPVYLKAHSQPATRLMHCIGTVAGISTVVGVGAALIATGNWPWALPGGLIGGLIVGYGFAWTSHSAFEKNVPLTAKGAIAWSFRADFRMLVRTLNGTIHQDLKKFGIERDTD